MDRQWTDNASTLDREYIGKDRFAQSRKNVRRGGLKDELFIGQKLPKIKENYIFTDYTD